MVSPEQGEEHQQDGLEEACNKLVHSIAEPLTAIGNYIETARLLSHGDAATAHQLSDVLAKAHNEVERAARVLNEMRQLLQKKKP